MMEQRDRWTPDRRQLWLRWLTAGFAASVLIAVSTTWQSWQRNSGGLQTRTELPTYFAAIWTSYLFWIGIAALIHVLHKRIPMFDRDIPLWWLYHLGLSLLIGLVHLFLDTLMLWLSLSNSFDLMVGYAEKLIRWLPYELLAYWACLSIITLVSNRTKLLIQDSLDYLKRLSYKSDGETRVIATSEIDYIEACDNYVKIWCGRERYMIKQTLSGLERQLNPNQFLRIHRSFIVNLDSIDGIRMVSASQQTVTLRPGQSLPISRRRRSELRKALSAH